MNSTPIHVVGAGLAGSEAAWQAANAGAPVILHEMRPRSPTPAHHTDGFAELVCSNSFRAADAGSSAIGLLHEEMRRCGSLILTAADATRVPAGGALAVDRDAFSAFVTEALHRHPLVRIEREEVAALPPPTWGSTILATGPLTSDALSRSILAETGEEALAFFDAIAPIVYRDSIDMSIAWMQSRYDKGESAEDQAAYINCPLDKDGYYAFLAALETAPKTDFKEWERDTPYFEGCLPIEEMARRGPETLRHGPMKPVGLTNPHAPTVKAYAIVQLRQDNRLGTLFNMVGFQTKLRYGAQAEVFRRIPGLEKAEFARLGGIHRNTFINSPRILDGALRMRTRPDIRFAGQITGVEGYVESAAIGLLAGRFAAAEASGAQIVPPPPSTALGALLTHVTGGHLAGSRQHFQPMNVNFGLFPPLPPPVRQPGGPRLRGAAKAQARKADWSARALSDLDGWLGQEPSREIAAAE